MPKPSPEKAMLDVMNLRCIASLATENEDLSIHLAAVWFLFEDGAIYIATSSRTRKARNLQARPKATLMVDQRNPGKERGVTVAGTADLISGAQSRALNHKIHGKYLSAEALADPQAGAVFAAIDDVTIRITPVSWISWDMAELDAQVFNGRLAANPGYVLPLD